MTDHAHDRASGRQHVGGHLNYYRQHEISPVRYQSTDINAHFERRNALYRTLGLPPIAFRGARVLEVAPGSGQNSLYVAALAPRELHLVEPNAAGGEDIQRLYGKTPVAHTAPTIHPVRLQEFAPAEPFDIVICENWLGGLPEECALLGSLARLTAPGGVLVVTTVPTAGFMANVLRKLLAIRLDDVSQDFITRTDVLLRAFSPHLATIAGMTRSHGDWVQDCMLNPHYLNVALSFEALLASLDDGMEVIGTNPQFLTDWRWFKRLTGAERRYDEQLHHAWQQQAHNFLDYRRDWPARSGEDNAPLIALCDEMLSAAKAWQAAREQGSTPDRGIVEDILARLAGALAGIDRTSHHAVDEFRKLWAKSILAADDVAELSQFGSWFGRETVYVSLGRRKHSAAQRGATSKHQT